jgi:hypothetical protein
LDGDDAISLKELLVRGRLSARAARAADRAKGGGMSTSTLTTKPIYPQKRTLGLSRDVP